MVNPTQMGTGKRYFRPLEQATTGTGMESETHIDVYSRSLFSPFNIMNHLKGTPGLHELVGLQLAGMLAPEQTVKQLERNTYSLNSYQKLIARYTPVSLHPYMLYATCYFFLYWWVCWVKLQSINPYTTCYQYTLTIRWLEPAITGYLYTITGWINQYTYYHWLLLVACSSPDTQYWLVSSLPLPRDSYWLLLLLITDCD